MHPLLRCAWPPSLAVKRKPICIICKFEVLSAFRAPIYHAIYSRRARETAIRAERTKDCFIQLPLIPSSSPRAPSCCHRSRLAMSADGQASRVSTEVLKRDFEPPLDRVKEMAGWPAAALLTTPLTDILTTAKLRQVLDPIGLVLEVSWSHRPPTPNHRAP